MAEQLEDLQRTVLSPEETFSFDKDLVYRFAAETPSKGRPADDKKPLSLGRRRGGRGHSRGVLWLLEGKGRAPSGEPRPWRRSEAGPKPGALKGAARLPQASFQPARPPGPSLPKSGSLPGAGRPDPQRLRGFRGNPWKGTNPTVSGSGHPDNDPGTSATPLLQSTAIAQLTEAHPGTFIPQQWFRRRWTGHRTGYCKIRCLPL